MSLTSLTQPDLRAAIVRDPLIVSPDTTVMAAIGEMSRIRSVCTTDRTKGYVDTVHQEARSSCVLVMAGGQILGILTERDLVRLSAQQRSLESVTVGEVMASPVLTLREEEFTDLFSAVNLLQQRRIRHLPILDQAGNLLGILTHESLRQLARPVDLLRLRLVSEVMTANVVCAPPDTSMLTIAQLMAERRVGSVLVTATQVDAAGNPLPIPLGIITERDIVQFQYLGLQLDRVEVQVVMSAPVFTVQPDDSLMVVQEIMEQQSIRRLVVTGAQGELLGIVTQTSLLQALNPLELYTLSKLLEEKVAQLEAERVKLIENYASELEHQVQECAHEITSRIEREQMMATISATIAASLHLPELLNTAVQELRSFLQCDRVVIWQFQADWSGMIVAESVKDGWRASLHDVIDDPCFRGDLVLRYLEGRTLTIDNIYTAGYPDCYIEFLEAYQVKANLVVPIMLSEGQLWGLLIGHECATDRAWHPEDVLLLNEMTVQLAIAIQKATAYQQAQAELAERRQIEDALRASEQRFASLANAAPVGIFRTDDLGNCLYVNERWSQIAGLTIDQAAGFGWVNGIHPDDRDLVSTEWNAAVAANRPFSLEYRFQNSAGQITWVYGQAVAEHNEAGTITGHVGTITDISDRKTAEQALKIQRDFNQLIAEITSRFVDLNPENLDAEIDRCLQLIGELTQVDTSFIIKFDNDAQTMSMSHEWSQPHCPRQIALAQAIPLTAFPWSTTLLRQREINYIPSVADLPAVAAIDQASWQQFNLTAVLAVPLVQKSAVIGMMGFASFSQTMIWEEDTIRLLCVMGQTIANAQERSQNAQQLLESEARFRAFIDHSPAASWIADPNDGRLEYISQSYHSMFLTPANILGQTIVELFPPDIAEIYLTNNHQVMTTGQMLETIEPGIRSDGSLGEFLVLKFPLPQADGRLLVGGVGIDVTDRRRAEAERLRAESLKRELTLLENILDTILAGYWDADLVTHQQYISPGFKTMFGYEDHELANSPETWKQLILPEDLPKAIASYTSHVQSHGAVPYYNELRYRHKNGSIVWVICTGRVIEWDPEGNPLRLIGCHIDITRQKQTEEELRQTKEEFERFFSVALDLLCIADTDGYFRRLNRSWETTLGYPLAELEGRSFLEFVHPDDLASTLEAISTLGNQETIRAFVNRYRCHDGTYRYIEWYSRPYGNMVYAAARDITDRKLVEEQLRRSSAHLKTAQRIGKLGSWEFSPKTGSIYWSDEVFRIFGLSPDADPPSFEGLQQALHPDDRDLHQQIVQTAIETAQPYNIEMRAQRPDGSLVYMFAQGEPIVNAAGELEQLVGTVLDITERKQTEGHLRNLTDRLNLAIKSAAIGIWDWNVPNNILIWDDRMYELYGTTPDQFSSAYDAWSTSLHPDDRTASETAIQQALSGEKDFDIEFRVIHPDGSIRVIQAYAVVQRNDQGDPQRMIGINFDITDRKQTEEKVRRYSAQLEASNRELEAFAYSVSHDLRSPLRAIDGFSLALLEDYGDQVGEEGKDYFDRIRKNVTRMGTLIDDLLSLSRVSRSEIRYTTVNLSTLAQELMNDLYASQPERRVEVAIAPNAIVSADASLMQVVLINLLQNAWKFTSHHPTARIEFGITHQEGDPVYFVRDDGAGFDMAYANMLFGVFQRLHNTHEFPGTGIGLATVQRAIHRHGGQVWAEAAIEQGATIYFTIPAIPIREGA